mmetsp:Transcript_16160/g.22268  ORF Transcript_16160/g.22268 Transcript_16160/m.22268 type:complete len:639 (-) Transcript_16160:209-2125(-)
MDIDYQDEDMEYTYEEDGEEYEEVEEDLPFEIEVENTETTSKWQKDDQNTRNDAGMTSGEDSVCSLPNHFLQSHNPTPNSSGKKRSKTHDMGFLNTKLIVPDDGYVIKDCSAVEPLMAALVSEVSSLLEIHEDLAQSLLQSNKWDKERLIDQFFADPEKALREAGLDLLTVEGVLSTLPSGCKSTGDDQQLSSSVSAACLDTFKCRICCDSECDRLQTFSLGCEHLFCLSCYSEYLKNQVLDGPACVFAHCPEHKCKQVVTKSVFHSLLNDKKDIDKYDLYSIRNFIEVSKNMKYCPAPRCEKVAIGSGVSTVRCACSYPFCFRCGEEAHEPCSCPQLSEWNEKCMNESETANWILANTRKCPSCNTRIEKNQGCNHMTCRLCKHEFCWICMGNWSEHGQGTGGFYKCNRFDSSSSSTAVVQHLSTAQKAKAELDRYLHYYQRYHGHDSALKFASNQREVAERRMQEQQQESQKRSSWTDDQHMKQAAEQVIDCRRVLKFTYVLGYFLTDNSPEKQLFEHHQEMLEKNTEKLHEYTERSLDQVDRIDVVNLTRVTEKFMASLLASMTGGVVMMIDDNSSNSSGTAGGVSNIVLNMSHSNTASDINVNSVTTTGKGPARAPVSIASSASRTSHRRAAKK